MGGFFSGWLSLLPPPSHCPRALAGPQPWCLHGVGSHGTPPGGYLLLLTPAFP